MMVRPELMSASSAPCARPLNSCERKFDQVEHGGQQRGAAVGKFAGCRAR